MLTLAAPLLIFNVTTIEMFWGRSSQFVSSWEEAKLMEVWGPEKCTPLTPMAGFTCTFGASLEGSFSRTKDRRSKGIKSEITQAVRLWWFWRRIFPCTFWGTSDSTKFYLHLYVNIYLCIYTCRGCFVFYGDKQFKLFFTLSIINQRLSYMVDSMPDIGCWSCKTLLKE